MKTTFFAILAFCALSVDAQTISTIAGTGSSAYSGDLGPAIAAGITNPTYGVFDKYGNYFISDVLAHRVRKIAPTGVIYTVAGNGSGVYTGDGSIATATGINRPHSVKLDTFGNLYIVQYANHIIRKVSILTGTVTTIAGNGVGAYSGDGGPATAASLYGPQDVAVDKWGNVYIADAFNYRVRKVDLSGNITTVAGTGVAGFSGDGGPAVSAQVAYPFGVAVDDTGNLYIADPSSFVCRIRKVSTTGIITTIAGNGGGTYAGDGIPALSASMAPYTVALDVHNNIYISDRFNNRTYKVDAVTGIFTCIAGNGTGSDAGDGGPATAASLYTPTGISVDKCDNVYITTIGDASVPGSGRRVRKVTYSTTGIAGIGITVLPNDTVCAGTAVTYSATLTDSSTTGYQWYKNGAPITGATNSTYTYTPTETGDDIHCVYTGIDVCSIAGHPASNTIHMVVTPLAVPTISLGGSTAAPLGSTVTVTATVGGAGSSYSIGWYRNGLPLATTTVPSVTYTKTAGTDAITARLSSTDAVDCYDTTTSATHTVLVGPNGVNDVAPQAMAVTISPNPARTVLHIDGAVHTWRIMGVTGAVLLQGGPLAGHSIMMQDLPAGMYYIELYHPTGQRTLHRFVKE